MNNEIRDELGSVIGYRCSRCDQVKTKMWGTVCNMCSSKTASQILIEENIYKKGFGDGFKAQAHEGLVLLESLVNDLSNSTIDGRLSHQQETFNNTLFQVITKIKGLIKLHYDH